MPAPPVGPACVLIVDDNADALKLTEHIVRRANPAVRVVVAHGGPQALAYLIEACRVTLDRVPMPDLILLDINMPITGGFEVLKWVRHNEAFADTRVVMLSTSEEPADIERATELGAHGYLIKFPQPTVLACVLNEARKST